MCVCVISQFGAKFNPVYQRYAMNYERASPYRHKLLSQPGYKKYQEVRVHCYGSWDVASVAGHACACLTSVPLSLATTSCVSVSVFVIV